jgi:hypothetical protein
MSVPQLAQSFSEAISAALTAQAVNAVVPVPPEIGTAYSDAVSHHAAETVARVRQCFEKGGADRVWRERFPDGSVRYHLLCQEPSGAWADRIIQKIRGAWEEITAFEPKGGTEDWRIIEKWLSNKDASSVRPANLPWLKP